MTRTYPEKRGSIYIFREIPGSPIRKELIENNIKNGNEPRSVGLERCLSGRFWDERSYQSGLIRGRRSSFYLTIDVTASCVYMHYCTVYSIILARCEQHSNRNHQIPMHQHTPLGSTSSYQFLKLP
jgi:hypothetical protein